MYKNKRHSWVKTSKSRDDLSYISVQVLNYNPLWPVATAADHLTPEEWTFARIEATHVVYVFPSSDGSTFSHLGGGCYSIPVVLNRFLQSLNIPSFISAFEHELKGLMTSQVEEDDC